LNNCSEITTETTGVKTMMMMFVIGFALGLITAGIVLIILMHHQDMKDLENRTGRYASNSGKPQE
tara:strand:+ start:3178 stop:3372 length:195 start_codon:yes stop_codon:yes gene_type:complete